MEEIPCDYLLPSLLSLHSIFCLFLLLCSGLFDGTDSGGECGVPHERRMVMPRPAPDQPWSVVSTVCTHIMCINDTKLCIRVKIARCCNTVCPMIQQTVA